MATVDDFKSIPLKTYLRLWGHYGSSINQECLQGTFVKLDEEAGLVHLESTVYSGRTDKVPIGKVERIEDWHTGSGASGPVQKPDKIYNPVSGEWQDKGYQS
ncbi:hypothetical protein [Jeongeupia naejangsanensis]|uniref:Uncharacterized protein n=1 Tax=Jeongeupia naejangsanensis TaxID=613195 RepID=A0ABS2BLY0_9NEIS|nr:hypothetical protein [Jeongeupia naejangsanensis]MBM3116621.1 hypothetical protein [Jeongeupia naejangsanensis]